MSRAVKECAKDWVASRLKRHSSVENLRAMVHEARKSLRAVCGRSTVDWPASRQRSSITIAMTRSLVQRLRQKVRCQIRSKRCELCARWSSPVARRWVL